MSGVPYSFLNIAALKVFCAPRIVEDAGARLFGLEEAEVIERRKYVGRVRKEIEVRWPYRN